MTRSARRRSPRRASRHAPAPPARRQSARSGRWTRSPRKAARWSRSTPADDACCLGSPSSASAPERHQGEARLAPRRRGGRRIAPARRGDIHLRELPGWSPARCRCTPRIRFNSSQADTEAADIARERAELASDPEFEHRELAAIYQKRGLDEETSDKVASQLMAADALAAHARDELSITHMTVARLIRAAWTSAVIYRWSGICCSLPGSHRSAAA